MITRDGFDRPLGALLDELAAPRVPEYLNEVLARTSRTRQRPAWTSPGRWLPMQATLRFTTVPRTAWLLALLALIVAVATAALVIGSRPDLPKPFGPARTGLLTFDSDGAIFTAARDGTNRVQLTTGPGVRSNPTFSPDGTRIAFWLQERAHVPASLVVMDMKGEHSRVLAENAVVDGPGRPISWSPDSSSIAYSTGFSPDEIFVARIEGTAPRKISPNGLSASDPAWSPDGRLIAFHGATDDPSDNAIYVVNSDGGDVRRLTHQAETGHSFSQPQWSSDGARLLYYAGPSGENDIWVVNADGSAETNLTNDSDDEFWPTWSPDGTQIAFDQDAKLVVMASDGNGRRQLDVQVAPAPPIWSPDGTQLYCFSPDTQQVEIVDVASGGLAVAIPASGNVGNGNWQRLGQ
jgi:Tol biopolymer transport system component